MNALNDTAGNYQIALANAAKGIVSIPCHPGTKIPAVKWKQWQGEMPPDSLFRAWFADARRNIAIVTTGMVLFDVDAAAKAELVLSHCGDTPHKLRTPRGGIHLGYRKEQGEVIGNRVRINGEPIDIRTDGGLEMIPRSHTEHGNYAWLGEGLRPIAELPVAEIGWTREKVRKLVIRSVEAVGNLSFMEYRASLWLANVEGAVSGAGGHNATFRVACKLTHYFGLDADAAMRLLLTIFNPKCEPPWSEKELLHKVEDALNKRK